MRFNVLFRVFGGGWLLGLLTGPVALRAGQPAFGTPQPILHPVQTRVTFGESGYADQIISGLSGSSAFYLRLPPTATLQNGQLVLYLKPSQALRLDQSSITVLVRSQPVLSARLDQLGPDAPLRIPLAVGSREPGSPFVQVELKTQLSVTDDRCKDLENPALWLKIAGESYVTFDRATNANRQLNLSNCLPAKTAILYPAQPTPADIRLVSALYTRLAAFRPYGVRLYPADHAPDSLQNLIVVGEIRRLPDRYQARLSRRPAPKQGLFFLSKPAAGSPEVLIVTGGDPEGYAKTAEAVANPNVLASAFGDFLLVDRAVTPSPAAPRSDRLTLAQLGGTPDLLQGIGSLRRSYGFRLGDFAEQPDEVEVHVDARYSGLQPGDRGFLNLYVNGVLFSSTLLDKSGLIAVSPRLKRYLLKPFNTLQAEFRFFPGTNVCQNSFLNFFAQVDVQRSFIRPTGPYSSESLSFLQFPGSFQHQPLAIIVSRAQLPAALPGVCELVRQLNAHPVATLTIPTLHTSDTDAATDASGGNLIALLDRDDAFWDRFSKAPVQFNRDFRLYSDDHNRPLITVSDTVSCGIAQVFREGKRAVLLLATGGRTTPEAFRMTARHVADPLTNLASNVLITAGPNRYFFNLTDDQSAIDYYDGEGPARDWWERYHLYVLSGLLGLVLAAFVYVRSKVKVSQAIFES